MDALQGFASGDTNYIAKLNENNADIKAAVDAIAATAQATSAKGAANGYAGLDSGGSIPLGQLPDLSAVYQGLTEKGAPSGYAPLGADGIVPFANLPPGLEPELAGVETVVHAAATYVPLTQKGAASGVATLDGGGTVPDAQIPSGIARDTEVDAAISLALAGYTPGMPSGTANKVLATDTSGGGSSTAALRALVAADIPDLSGTYKLASADPVWAIGGLSGKPAASAVLLWFLPGGTVTIPANLAGTRCKVGTNPTATATLSVKRDGTEVATIQIATDGTVTLSTQASFTVTSAQELTVVAPGSQDTTLADVRVMIAGTR